MKVGGVFNRPERGTRTFSTDFCHHSTWEVTLFVGTLVQIVAALCCTVNLALLPCVLHLIVFVLSRSSHGMSNQGRGAGGGSRDGVRPESRGARGHPIRRFLRAIRRIPWKESLKDVPQASSTGNPTLHVPALLRVQGCDPEMSSTVRTHNANVVVGPETASSRFHVPLYIMSSMISLLLAYSDASIFFENVFANERMNLRDCWRFKDLESLKNEIKFRQNGWSQKFYGSTKDDIWHWIVGSSEPEHKKLVKKKGSSYLSEFGDKLFHCVGLAPLFLSLLQICTLYCLCRSIVLLSRCTSVTSRQEQHQQNDLPSFRKKDHANQVAETASSPDTLAASRTHETIAVWHAIIGQLLVMMNRMLIFLVLQRLPFLHFVLPNYTEPSRKFRLWWLRKRLHSSLYSAITTLSRLSVLVVAMWKLSDSVMALQAQEALVMWVM